MIDAGMWILCYRSDSRVVKDVTFLHAGLKAISFAWKFLLFFGCWMNLVSWWTMFLPPLHLKSKVKQIIRLMKPDVEPDKMIEYVRNRPPGCDNFAVAGGWLVATVE